MRQNLRTKRTMTMMIVSPAKRMPRWVTTKLIRLNQFWIVSFQKHSNWNLQFQRLMTIMSQSTNHWPIKSRNRRWSMLMLRKTLPYSKAMLITSSSLIW
jgi:hypothetical protein